MGHTNSTANIALPQFIGTDKPTWLGDVNGAFSAIDSKVGTIDADIAAVDAKADTAVSDASAAVTTATNANNTAGTASTTATQANNIANNALTVANHADGHTNQLETKVGLLADLTTTDKTSIVNAINEVNAGLGGSTTAAQVSYDNTGSGLSATDVQAAIDEVVSLIPGGVGSVEVTADGVKTFSQLFDSLYALIDRTKITKDATITYDGYYSKIMEDTGSVIKLCNSLVTPSVYEMRCYHLTASGSQLLFNSNGTVSDISSSVPTSGKKIVFYY